MESKTLLFENPQNVTQAELEKDLELLPNWRREQTEKFRFLIDKVLCAKAYLLLKKGLKEFYSIQCNPDFSYEESGKPFLKNYPYIHFNLSHCKKAVLCVLDEENVGCDAEEIPDSLDVELMNACFNDEEICQIKNAEQPCVEFAKLWTQKEAYLKLTGTGLTDDLKTVFSEEIRKNIKLQTFECQEKGFVYSVCSFSGCN